MNTNNQNPLGEKTQLSMTKLKELFKTLEIAPTHESITAEEGCYGFQFSKGSKFAYIEVDENGGLVLLTDTNGDGRRVWELDHKDVHDSTYINYFTDSIKSVRDHLNKKD